jgi:hypothetical protein
LLFVLVSPLGVPERSNFNSLVCPTAFKAATARKREFPKLSSLSNCHGLAAVLPHGGSAAFTPL